MPSEETSRPPPSTESTDTAPVAGLLFVNSSIKNKSVQESTFHAWYSEHIGHVLSAPGNSGLFLRYRNLKALDHVYTDPNSLTKTIQDRTWPFLALVKLDDIRWLKSPTFAGIPIHSPLLPLEGIMANKATGQGAAFDAINFGARAYSLVTRDSCSSSYQQEQKASRRTQPTHLIIIQTTSTPTTEDENSILTTPTSYLGNNSYRLNPNFIPFQEPGDIPPNMTIYQYGVNNDDDEAAVTELVNIAEKLATTEKKAGEEKGIIRIDLWAFIYQGGDGTL